jgi:hypothetical protein
VVRKGHGRMIQGEGLRAFWEEEVGDQLAFKCGCYVFGIRAGRGIVPLYVGRATRSFKQECFTLHKRHKIDVSLLHWMRGTPLLFLVPLQRRRGPVNRKLIARAEQFLIQNAVARNPNLANVHGTEQETWGIKGVLRAGNGRPSESAKAFKGMMGL